MKCIAHPREPERGDVPVCTSPIRFRFFSYASIPEPISCVEAIYQKVHGMDSWRSSGEDVDPEDIWGN